MLMIIFLFTVTSVSAGDVNETIMTSIEETPIEINEMDELEIEENNEVLTADEGNFQELQNEINNAINAGDKELKLNRSYSHTGDGFKEGISISQDDFVLDGGGNTIDAQGKSRIFDIGGNGVTIKNLIIINGYYNYGYYGYSSNGGAFYFSNSGNVENCNFTNNEASGDDGVGGAVYFSNGGSLTNCNFNGNNASKYGGAIYMGSGTVSNCNFTSNYVAGYGGAVWMSGGTVTNCNFNGNRAHFEGGAVWMSGGAVTNCNFNGNRANSYYGGAIWRSGGTVTNCNFSNNYAYLDGGAVYSIKGGSLTNCNFDGNYAAEYGGAIRIIEYCTVINCNFSNNDVKLYGGGSMGGAIWIYSGIVENCNFINNRADSSTKHGGTIKPIAPPSPSPCWGGAVYFDGDGVVTNCNFNGNAAISYYNGDEYGGAVYFNKKGTVTNCNFDDNTAKYGGAVCFNISDYNLRSCNVINCNFANNNASEGGAIYGQIGREYYTHILDTTTYFIDEKYFCIVDTCIFKTSSDSTYNTNILPPSLNGSDFETFYNSGEKLTFDLKTNSGIPVDNGNISISLYYKNNDSWIANYSFLSSEEWIVDFPVGSYYAIFNTEYAGFQKLNRTISIKLFNPHLSFENQEVQYGNNTIIINYNNTATGIINITLKGKKGNYSFTGIDLNNIISLPQTINADDYEVKIIYCGDEIFSRTAVNATLTIGKINSRLMVNDMVFDCGTLGTTAIAYTGATGVIAKILDYEGAIVNFKGNTITVSGLDVGTYTLSVTTIPDENHNPVTQNATITVNKFKTELTPNTFSTTYNTNGHLLITLKDSQGKPLINRVLHVDLNGARAFTTDSKGQIKIAVGNWVPKTYTVKVTFNGNDYYAKSTKSVKVTVKKATPKLTAKSKTFKKSSKIKKYSITLKNNKNKAMKKVKVTLKIKGKKSITIKTNNKGKATFKIKLTKKGNYKATVTYKGNKYYNKITQKVKIKVK